jgi:hypothetical protein
MKKPLQMLVFSALGLVALPRTADACDCVSGRVRTGGNEQWGI